ncbi:hypothetical protein H4R35_004833 [Dimargaris xerosporica]|nr:hypothetical protein H4R35_004833 [Dimargaris xerosporica]
MLWGPWPLVPATSRTLAQTSPRACIGRSLPRCRQSALHADFGQISQRCRLHQSSTSATSSASPPPRLRSRQTLGLAGLLGGATLLYYQYEPFRHPVQAVARCGLAGFTGIVVGVDYKWSLYKKPDPKLDPALRKAQGLPCDADTMRQWQDAVAEYEQRKSQVHRRSAQRVLKSLMVLGGIYIKLGQHLSAMNYILPREWTSTMTPLQDRCPETSLEDIDQLLRADLGASMDDLFTEFDPLPLGIASLAQVHRAVLRSNGREVAVKIQHPYLDEFAKVDMDAVSFILRWASRLFPEFQFGWLSEEMNVSLPQELDFVRERQNAERVRQNFAHMPRCPLVVPQVYWAYRRVMAMEYIRGSRIDDRAYMRTHGIDPDQVATELTRIFSEMIFIHGWVHCDPHPGNVLVRPRAWQSGKHYNFDVVLLDHGLYRELSGEFRMNYAYMWRALLAGNEHDIRYYSKLLAGTDLYIVFACILTGRDWRVIQNDLSQEKSAAEITTVFDRVPYLLTEIVDVLATVPRQLLLLFKANDLLRAVDESLRTKPSQTITMAIMGRFCTKAIYQETMASIQYRIREHGLRWSLLAEWWSCQWQYWRLELPLELVEWGYRLYSLVYRQLDMA